MTDRMIEWRHDLSAQENQNRVVADVMTKIDIKRGLHIRAFYFLTSERAGRIGQLYEEELNKCQFPIEWCDC